MPKSFGPFGLSLDAFALRQFDAQNKHSFIPFAPHAFIQKVNDIYKGDTSLLKDGYAPFCKHIFIENFTEADTYYLPITLDNERSLRSVYRARRPEELAVLSRFFPSESVQVTKAKYLDLILYSREQIRKENAAMGEESHDEEPWGVISIKPQDCNEEIPMEPITMMRNALPIEEGGSGTVMDRNAYAKSVAFWSAHAIVQ